MKYVNILSYSVFDNSRKIAIKNYKYEYKTITYFKEY